MLIVLNHTFVCLVNSQIEQILQKPFAVTATCSIRLLLNSDCFESTLLEFWLFNSLIYLIFTSYIPMFLYWNKSSKWFHLQMVLNEAHIRVWVSFIMVKFHWKKACMITWTTYHTLLVSPDTCLCVNNPGVYTRSKNDYLPESCFPSYSPKLRA